MENNKEVTDTNVGNIENIDIIKKIEEKLEKRKNRLIKSKRTYTNKIRMNELNLIKRILLEEK